MHVHLLIFKTGDVLFSLYLLSVGGIFLGRERREHARVLLVDTKMLPTSNDGVLCVDCAE